MATMPAALRPRQANVAEWFATQAGQALALAQLPHLQALLASRPHQPLLWLSPCQAWPAQAPGKARCVWLHRFGPDWAGDLRGQLPLPLASASIGTVLVQHPEPAGAAELLGDCARLLLPGGVLLLVVGRGMHPQRVLHPGLPLWRQPRPAWRRLLASNGLVLRGCHRLEAGALGSLAGACVVLEAEKRTQALIGPRPVPRLVTQPAGRQCLKVT